MYHNLPSLQRWEKSQASTGVWRVQSQSDYYSDWSVIPRAKGKPAATVVRRYNHYWHLPDVVYWYLGTWCRIYNCIIAFKCIGTMLPCYVYKTKEFGFRRAIDPCEPADNPVQYWLFTMDYLFIYFVSRRFKTAQSHRPKQKLVITDMYVLTGERGKTRILKFRPGKWSSIARPMDLMLKRRVRLLARPDYGIHRPNKTGDSQPIRTVR